MTHRYASAGLALVAAASLFFVLRALPSPWAAMPAVALAGAAAAAWGLWNLREVVGRLALAAGLALLAVFAGLYMTFAARDGHSLHAFAGALLLLGHLVAAGHVAAWLLRADEAAPRLAGIKAGFALVALGAFLQMALSLGGGSLGATFALALAAIGWSFAAPNVDLDAPAHARRPGTAGEAA